MEANILNSQELEEPSTTWTFELIPIQQNVYYSKPTIVDITPVQRYFLKIQLSGMVKQ